MIIPQIKKAILSSKAKKIFILNVANKPFETKNFSLLDFVGAISDHIGTFPFKFVIANNNLKYKIPQKHKQYKYVPLKIGKNKNYELIVDDLIDKNFPLYHDSSKLAKAVYKNI